MAGRRVPRWLRAALAFLGALALWLAAAEAYHRVLGSAAAAILRDDGPGAIHVEAGGEVTTAARIDRPAARVRVPMPPLTSNVLLLVTLWAWAAPRRPSGFAIGALAVGTGHLFAIIAGIHANLALARGGDEHYGVLATNFWFVAWQGYQLVGSWAVAFGAWWWTAAAAPPGSPAPGVRPKRSRG